MAQFYRPRDEPSVIRLPLGSTEHGFIFPLYVFRMVHAYDVGLTGAATCQQSVALLQSLGNGSGAPSLLLPAAGAFYIEPATPELIMTAL